MRPVPQQVLCSVSLLVLFAVATPPAGAQPGAARGASSAEVRSPSEFAPIELNDAVDSLEGGPAEQSRREPAERRRAYDSVAERTPIRRQTADSAPEGGAARGRIGSPWTTLITLAAVLIGAALAARLLRRVVTGQSSGTSDSALDVLASRRLDAQSSIHLVRIGRRVVAVGSSPAGVHPLTEIDDPEEVALLLADDAAPSSRGGQGSKTVFVGARPIRRTHLASTDGAVMPEGASRIRRPTEIVRGPVDD